MLFAPPWSVNSIKCLSSHLLYKSNVCTKYKNFQALCMFLTEAPYFIYFLLIYAQKERAVFSFLLVGSPWTPSVISLKKSNCSSWISAHLRTPWLYLSFPFVSPYFLSPSINWTSKGFTVLQPINSSDNCICHLVIKCVNDVKYFIELVFRESL